MSAYRGVLLTSLAVVVFGAGAAGIYVVSSSVEVVVDGEVLSTRVLPGDAAAVLARLDVEVSDADQVEPGLDTPIEDGLRLVVTRGKTVEVHIDGRAPQTVKGLLATVADALREAGLDDLAGTKARVEPALDTAVADGDRIDVKLPTVVEEVAEEAIAHGEQRRETDDLIEGETRVTVEGEDGIRHKTYAVTWVGGQEVERELLADEIIRDPTDRVVLVGTAPGPVREAQTLLTALGYPAGPIDGIEGAQTHRALCAWRRLEGHEASRRALQPGELEALRATASLPAADPGRGVTVDRACQVLYFRDGGQWQHVHQASTGADGLPRPGSYTIQRTREGWHTSTLYPAPQPNMYNSLYIRGAIAIHGSNHVPPHPASAGCVRVTPSAADQLFADLRVGDPVDVIDSY